MLNNFTVHLLQAFSPFCYHSGTLSYIFNNFKGTRAFSNVVAEAKQAGYTEPDPRDDLSGTDVARKVLYTSLNVSNFLVHALLLSNNYIYWILFFRFHIYGWLSVPWVIESVLWIWVISQIYCRVNGCPMLFLATKPWLNSVDGNLLNAVVVSTNLQSVWRHDMW